MAVLGPVVIALRRCIMMFDSVWTGSMEAVLSGLETLDQMILRMKDFGNWSQAEGGILQDGWRATSEK